jgi:hypothetical protein
VDPAVINLTAFETRFQEQRPFFIEGADITSMFGEPGGRERSCTRAASGRSPHGIRAVGSRVRPVAEHGPRSWAPPSSPERPRRAGRLRDCSTRLTGPRVRSWIGVDQHSAASSRSSRSRTTSPAACASELRAGQTTTGLLASPACESRPRGSPLERQPAPERVPAAEHDLSHEFARRAVAPGRTGRRQPRRGRAGRADRDAALVRARYYHRPRRRLPQGVDSSAMCRYRATRSGPSSTSSRGCGASARATSGVSPGLRGERHRLPDDRGPRPHRRAIGYEQPRPTAVFPRLGATPGPEVGPGNYVRRPRRDRTSR